MLIISIQPVLSQVGYFNKIDTLYGASAGNGIIETDSCYFVAGNMIDTSTIIHQRIFLNEYTKTGDLLWSKTWGNQDKSFTIGWTNPLITTDDNGFALIGSIQDSSMVWHGILLKLNSNGDSVWMRHYFDTISLCENDFLGFRGISQTYDNGFIIVGEIRASNTSDDDIFLLKTDSLGNAQWYKTYGYLTTIDRGFSVIQTPDSGYVIGGDVYVAGMDYSVDAYIIRTDKEGNKIWDKFLGGTKSDLIAYVALSYDSNYIVAYSYGYRENPPASPRRRISVQKITPSKQILWGKTFIICDDNVVYNVFEVDNHEIIIIGDSWVIDSVNQVGGRHAFIMKLSEDGDSLWYRDYSHVPHISNFIFNYFWDLKQTSDGGFIACGNYKNSFTGVVEAIWLVKTDSMGCDTPGCNTIGIQEYNNFKISEINVYPNPAYKYLTVEKNSPDYESICFELYDCYGRKVKEIELTKPTQTISLDGINDGMYFYRVRIKGKILGIGKVLVVR